jgi:hypothetical protein
MVMNKAHMLAYVYRGGGPRTDEGRDTQTDRQRRGGGGGGDEEEERICQSVMKSQCVVTKACPDLGWKRHGLWHSPQYSSSAYCSPINRLTTDKQASKQIQSPHITKGCPTPAHTLSLSEDLSYALLQLNPGVGVPHDTGTEILS